MLISDVALARRLEQNEALNAADYAYTMAQLHPNTRAGVMAVAGGYAAFTSPGLPVNGAHGMAMTGPVTNADLDSVEGFFREAGSAFRVSLCPLADPSLVELLNQRGYRIVQFLNTHIRRLTASERQLAPVPGVEVTAIEPSAADLWALTAVRGFLDTDEVAPDDPWLFLGRLVFNRPGVTCFLGWVDGQVAGAAALTVRDGLGTLFSTSTRPEFRGRGVHTALVRARLAAAAAAGCDFATVATVPGSNSERNVQRADFQIVYTRLAMARSLPYTPMPGSD